MWVRVKIDQIRRKFLWKGPTKEGQEYNLIVLCQEYNLIAWKKIYMSKDEGGLGIKQTSKINLSLLTKWGEKSVTKPQTSVSSVL